MNYLFETMVRSLYGFFFNYCPIVMLSLDTLRRSDRYVVRCLSKVFA
ncbi:MAG: hypothetical protein F6K18_32810 [Okeania sp. SIO2C2]|nr:hypothetical protein [Okeania sp. SIO2C2]NEP91201.1 hypothetical protein [Okeania sp. SIO2C2]